MKKATFLLIATALLTIASSQPASAHSSSNVQLTITPKVCVVDVTQDGHNQTVQTLSPGCEVALPNLAPLPNQSRNNPLFALPFAGSSVDRPLLQQRLESSWSPFISKGESGRPTHPPTYLTLVATGLAVAAIASAIGIDIALFELHYSRATLRLVHKWSIGRLLKK